MSEPEKVIVEAKVANVHGLEIAVIKCEGVLVGTKVLDYEVTIPTFNIKGEKRDEFLNEIKKCIEKHTLYS